jgi:hypothetical protein
MLATSLEKPEVGFILAGISCSSPCRIIILLESVEKATHHFLLA